jgi:hypothetical protein
MKTLGTFFSSLAAFCMFSAVIVGAGLVLIFGGQNQKI